MNENRVEGVEDVIKNLNDTIARMKGVTTGQLLGCAHIIIAEAQERVPVEFGDLKRSAFARMAQDGSDTAEFGFTQNYAVYVHEIEDNHHDNGEAKFLENAIKAKESQCFSILTNAAMRGKS